MPSSYQWRRISTEEREACLTARKEGGLPWHLPPHYNSETSSQYLITAACYEHKPIIGASIERLTSFESALIELSQSYGEVIAWVVLPNHYHFLFEGNPVTPLLKALGQFHGKTSFDWNGEDRSRGRKVFHGLTERFMRTDRHAETTVNYIHHNPVKHGYVELWQDWPFSSVHRYLETEGREKLLMRWKDYPVLDYGAKWDM
ncbi:MAG: hypothetical protein CMO55_26945 [Verrucomicrobiales bacterium]|nr:hypothetical protein [Verrucomicrobiales bacterium]